MAEDSPAKMSEKEAPCAASQATQNSAEGGTRGREPGLSPCKTLPKDLQEHLERKLVAERATTGRQRAVREHSQVPSTKLPMPEQRSGQVGENPAPAGGLELARRSTESSQLAVSDKDSKSLAPTRGHGDLLAELAYVFQSDKMGLAQGPLFEAAAFATANFQEQMRPKDALERLALAQALMAHGRVACLTKLAATKTDVPSIIAINEACDRATATFVRLMRAINEYRQPPRPGTTVSIGQANLAQQQVVQNIREGQQKQNVDERSRIRRSRTEAGAEALSAVQEGAAVAPDRRLANPAMDKEHRPQKPGRKGANPHERAQARRAVRRQRGTPETDEGDPKGTAG
jgi:hypothetical protein